MAFLESKRLTYGAITEEDVYPLSEYFDWMNDHEVVKSLESRYFPNTLERLRDYIKANQPPNNILLGIFTKEEYPKHVGNVRLGGINWQSRFAELGLVLAKKYWGKGYATEAISTISDYAFNRLNLHKVWCGILGDNIASIRAFGKAGFQVEGTLRQQYYRDGEYLDDVVMARFNNNA